MATVNCAYIYGEGDPLDLHIEHHAATANTRGFQHVRLGPLSLHLSYAQLTELANSLCDYLAESQEEVATTGEAGLAAA